MKYFITVTIWEITPRSIVIHLEDVVGMHEIEPSGGGQRMFCMTADHFECSGLDPLSELRRPFDIKIRMIKE